MKNLIQNWSARSVRILVTSVLFITLILSGIYFFRTMIYEVTSNDQCAWREIPGQPHKYRITDVVPGGVTDRAGIKNNDVLLKIDGVTFDKTPAQHLLNSHRTGEYATYLIEREGNQFEVRVEIIKLFNVIYLAQFLLGFGFLIVGYVVVMTKPLGTIQRMFGWYGILSMLFFGLPVTDFSLRGAPFWQFVSLLAGFLIARTFAPPVFVGFFLHFPVKRKILQKKWFNPVLYTVSICFGMAPLMANRIDIPLVVLVIAAFTPYTFYIAGLVIFTRSYFRFVDKAKRKELAQILIAGSVGIAVFSYILILYSINPFLIFLNPIVVLPVLFLPLVPFAFGYAIFHHRVMDIDLVIKRSLIYGAVTTALAAIYLLFVLGLGSLFALLLGHSENNILSVIGLIVIAFIFDPVKRRVQESIDKVFYRERHNYQKALKEFSQELPRLMNLEQISNSMASRIADTMHIEKIAVVLCDETEGCYCINKNIPSEYCLFAEKHESLITLLKNRKAPQSFSLLADEPDSFQLNSQDREKILKSGVVLAVPMFLQERLIGTINVGPKMSGKIYSQEDIDLLSTVASQAAIAIENARLHRSELEKQQIQEELALARRIQQGLLPKSDPEIEGLDISGISIPALTVGGDYFDYIKISNKELLIVIADVSGKGMSASLYMSKVQGMVQLAAQIYTSPKDILVHVNRLLYDGMERKSFITMILALFNMGKKEVVICRAGHNKAIVQDENNYMLLGAKGIGVGLERGPLFERELEEVRQPLGDGKIFLFYTDGLTETMDEKRNEMGEEAVLSCVKEESHRTSREIQQILINKAEKFRGSAEQFDDITLVVVKSI